MASALPVLVQRIRDQATIQQHRAQSDDLLQLFVHGKDQHVFAELIRRHGALVVGVCSRMLGNAHDAEDACQAVLLILACKAATIQKSESLASWLYGASVRVAMKAKRDAARRRKHEQNAPEARASAPPDQEAGWREVQSILDEEIQRLAPTFREAFVLCVLEGHSKAEAAEQLGIKEGTLSSRLARARERLQKQLSKRGISLTTTLAALAVSQKANGSLSERLVESTAKAAAQYCTGSKVTVSGFSATALTLAEGAMKTMFMSKVNTTILVLLTFGLLGIGAPPSPQSKAHCHGERPTSGCEWQASEGHCGPAFQ